MDKIPSPELISIDKLQEAFDLIRLCAEDLKNKGFSHWIDYYSDLETFQKKVEENKSEVYVIYIDGKPAATFTLSRIPPRYFIEPEIPPVDEMGTPTNFMHFFTPADPEDSVLYPTALAVRPELQGKGIARDILHKIEEMAKQKGIKAIRFDTRAEFVPANKLYQSMGYAIAYVDRFSDTENYYFYEKILE